MPIPILFILGYSIVLGTYEVAKTTKKPTSKKLMSDVIKYGKNKKH